MEEAIRQPGLFTKVREFFSPENEDNEDHYEPARSHLQVHTNRLYSVTLHRAVKQFGDALEIADGLKSGEQQIVNLANCSPELREKVTDFLSGVRYTVDASWEEIAEHIFLIAPANVDVLVVADERSSSPGQRARNRLFPN